MNRKAIEYAIERHNMPHPTGYAHAEKVNPIIAAVFAEEVDDGFIAALVLALLDQGSHSLATQDAVIKALKNA